MSTLISTANNNNSNNSNSGTTAATMASSSSSSTTVYSVSGINHSIVPTTHKMVTTTTTTLSSNDEIAFHILDNYVGPSDPIALLISVEGWTTRATSLINTMSTSGGDNQLRLEDLVDALPLSVRRIIVLEPASTVVTTEHPGLALQLARAIVKWQEMEACTAAHRLLLARRIPQVIRYQAEASLSSSENASNVAADIHEIMCQLVQHTIDVDQVIGAQLVVEHRQ
ncbi:hypothetical protein BDF22DRAFT_740563 [Syncephalis plumigaleata]|nr:hypothetical protein BDF22DRAFT_740563 [Syncephalis plumigaleata]